MYSYACDGSEQRSISRDVFIEYIHDLKPDQDKIKDASFDVQSKSMLDDLDNFRAGFGA